MRLFLLYVVIELAVVVALASTIGIGWTLLVVVGTFAAGLALAGAQLRRQLNRLRSGLTGATAQGAVTDGALVALGTLLVVVPGLASSVAGVLLLLPPTRAAARPLATALAARTIGRRVPLITVAGVRPTTRSDYIDGEVINVADVTDVAPQALERRPD